MRVSAIAVLLLASTPAAHAEDPHDIFGLGPKRPTPPPPPAIDCTDGTAFGCVGATDPLADVSPGALATWLTAPYLLGLPVADATHDAVAHYGTGGARDDTGVLFGGASGLEHRWTIDGAPADNLRSGGVDTRLPLTFLTGIRTIAGGFSARDRVSTGGTIDAQLISGGKDHALVARVWGSLSAQPRRRSIALGAYQLRRLYGDPGPEATLSLVASGPLGRVAGGQAWYAAGVAPSIFTNDLLWDTRGIVDTDGDGLADRNPDGSFTLEQIQTDERRVTSWFVPAMARVGYDKGPHHVALSLVGHTAREERDFSLATIQAARVERTTLTGDAIATYRYTQPKTRAKVQLAWHRSAREEHAADPTAETIPQLLSGYVPATLAEDPGLAAACLDADPTMFVRCPIPGTFFASGGPGLLVDQIGDRPTISADLAHQVGNHVLRAGATFEDTRLVTRSRYSGGAQVRSLFDGHTDTARFRGTGACSEDFQGACDYQDVSELNFRTRYTAAYIEDTFHPTRNIAVDAGLRWELMWVGPAIHFSNQLSPRLGLAWDLTGDGRGKAWATMGRSFAYLPAGLGDTVLPGNRRVRDIDIAGIGQLRQLETGAALPVDRDLAPATSDELTAGISFGLANLVELTGWAQGRRLRSMETTTSELTNPSDGHETAARHTTSFAAELATTGKLALRIGYLYTRTVGSTVGGAGLYDSTDFDGPTVNLMGRLPTDLGHRVFVEARRIGSIGALPIGGSLRLVANSGRPRDAIGLGNGTAYLVPRGTYGRGPMIMQANAELFARVAGLDVTLTVFNVFDRREATAIDDVYTSDAVSPIANGTAQDLVFLKTDGGSPVTRSTNFQYGTVFQAPIAATLGIRRAF